MKEWARAVLPPGLRPCLDSVRSPDATEVAYACAERTTQARLSTLRAHLSTRSRPYSTVRAYCADWRRWSAWCRVNGGRTDLPADSADLALYFATEYAAGVSAASVDRWAAAIAVVHTAHHGPNPTVVGPTAEVLRALRRRRRRIATSHALTDEEFDQLLLALPPDVWPTSVIRRRDRLILTLGRELGLPPDRLLNLACSDVVVDPEASCLHVQDDGEIFQVHASKQPLSCAVCAVVEWRTLLDAADEEQEIAPSVGSICTSGHSCQARVRLSDRPEPLFRRLHRGGSIGKHRPAAEAVRTIVQRYARAAGVDARSLTSFSLRRPT